MERNGTGGWADAGGVEVPVAGVRALSHTADVGLEVEAPSLPELFRRAAHGTLWLVLEEVLDDRSVTRPVRLRADDPAGLLRSWLREILYWQEVEGFAAAEILDLDIDDGELDGRVRGGPSPPRAVREIKGVTWHGLTVEPRDDGWFARVIFDV